MMTKPVKALVCLSGVAVLCLGASSSPPAESMDSNYETIITNRNVFQLRTPPPPAPVVDTSKPPPPKILLTGITTILGEPLALLKCTPPAAKGEQTKEKSYTLTINEREDQIEVKSIDVEKGIVQVDDYGTLTNLTFEKDSPKVAGGPPVNGAPNHPPGIPQPTPFNPGGGPRTIPQRTLRFPGSGGRGGFSSAGDGGMSAPATFGGATAAPASYGGGTPSINLNGTTLSMAGGAPQPGQPIIAGQDLQGGNDPEAYAVLLEAERQATAADVQSGKTAPLPVTRYTPAGAPGTLSEENPGETAGPNSTGGAVATPTMPPVPGRPMFHPY